MTEEELIRKLGRKWRVNLNNLYGLCLHYKRVMGLILPISTRSERLMGRLGINMRNLANVIEMAVGIGLLNVIDEHYGHSHHDDEDNYCRKYMFDRGLVDLITYKANNAHNAIYNYDRNDKLYLIKEIEGYDDERNEQEIRLAELPEISCKKEYTVNKVDRDMFMAGLVQRYPQIRETRALLRIMRDSAFAADEDHWFCTYMEPHVKETKKGTYTFSCRANSELCSVRKDPADPMELSRVYLLDDYFGKDNWEEFDLNASIYRIARSCRDKKWYGDPADIYEKLHGGPFSNDEERDEFKGICMITVFTKDEITACRAYRKKFDRWTMKDSEIKPIIGPVRKAVNEFCGDVDTDVFLHESCIISQAAYKLYSRGIKAVQLYDCLFVEKGKLTDFNSLVSECFERYSRKYLNISG